MLIVCFLGKYNGHSRVINYSSLTFLLTFLILVILNVTLWDESAGLGTRSCIVSFSLVCWDHTCVLAWSLWWFE